MNYIFQDPQGSLQIEFHKNKYHFGKKKKKSLFNNRIAKTLTSTHSL